jgi:hypothetical protein
MALGQGTLLALLGESTCSSSTPLRDGLMFGYLARRKVMARMRNSGKG